MSALSVRVAAYAAERRLTLHEAVNVFAGLRTVHSDGTLVTLDDLHKVRGS